MDITTIIGLVGGVLIIFFGIVTGADKFAGLPHFGDVPSTIITIGGTFICMLFQAKSIPHYLESLKSIGLVMKVQTANEAQVIGDIVNLSNVARKEGLLALEEMANNLEDEFLKKGIMLIVDGTDPELVRNIMETELASVDKRHNEKIDFWGRMAGMGPAWGMIGTLIGLVNMLADLGGDMNSIGANMAVALITTLYGSLVANWIATPIANKLKLINNNEYQMKEIIIEGLLSIQAGENPRVIEEKLKSFLSPDARNTSEDAGVGGEA